METFCSMQVKTIYLCMFLLLNWFRELQNKHNENGSWVSWMEDYKIMYITLNCIMKPIYVQPIS